MVNEMQRRLDPREIERALEEFHPSSFGWALSCCDWNREDAEEVLQASYLKAIEGRARFNGHSSTRSWFFGVVRNTAAEKRRYRIVRRIALDRWSRGRPEVDPAPSPEKLSSRAETQRQLRRMLVRLSTRQRELIHLVFYQEMTIEDAANVLHISIGTARTHYERGKTRLRVLMSGVGEKR